MKINFPPDVDKYTLDKMVYRNRLLHQCLVAMKVFGLALFTDQIFRRVHCFRGVFLSVSFVVFNITQYMDLVYIWGNVEEMTINAATTLLFTTTTIRIYKFYQNRTAFTQIIAEVDKKLNIIFDNGSEMEIKIANKNIKYMHRLTLIFTICALGTGNLMCVTTLVQAFFYNPVNTTMATNLTITEFNKTNSPPVILRSWFPFDNVWENYYIVYLVQFYVMWIGMIIVPSWHSFIVGLMLYIITQLDILDYKLRHLKDYGNEYAKIHANQFGFSAQSIAKAQYNVLRECIETYQDAISFTKRLNDLISTALFIDFIIFSVLLCTLLFQASKAGGFGINLIINFCYIVTMTAILWMYYWHANDITLKCSALSMSIYCSTWYEFSGEVKKSMLIFMNAHPVKMTAGFIGMNLDTFLSILRASYSYFTLLTQLEN